MSDLSSCPGMLAFVDDIDGKGSLAFAETILADPNAARPLHPFVDAAMLSEVLESQGATMRRVAEHDIARLMSCAQPSIRQGTAIDIWFSGMSIGALNFA